MASSLFGLSVAVVVVGAQALGSPLGVQRSEFGDKTDSPEWKKPGGPQEPWFFQNSSETYPTLMYFPAGRADERYYINTTEVRSPLKSAGKGKSIGTATLRETLVYETRHNGKIRLEWKVDLIDVSHDRKRLPKLTSGLGTMLAMLARAGLIVGSPVPPTVSSRLNVVEGIAAYRFNKAPAPPGVHYWLIRPSGADGRHYFDNRPWTSPTVHLPRTPRPYPVTDEERALAK